MKAASTGRGGTGRFSAWARATAGTIDFDSTRNFSGDRRRRDGHAQSPTASGTARFIRARRVFPTKRAWAGSAIRPNASIEYYKLNEKGYTETGGGDAFDLTVASRTSNETRGNALLALGYDLSAAASRTSLDARSKLEGGRREILSGSLGKTTASFRRRRRRSRSIPKSARAAGAAACALLAGGSPLAFAAEANAEEQQDKVSLGGRLGGQLRLLGSERGGSGRPFTLPGARRPDRQGVDALAHQVAERRIDQALALDARLAGEGRRFRCVSEKWLSPAGL